MDRWGLMGGEDGRSFVVEACSEPHGEAIEGYSNPVDIAKSKGKRSNPHATSHPEDLVIYSTTQIAS